MKTCSSFVLGSLALFAGFLVSPRSAHALLVFETVAQSVPAKWSDQKIEAAYKFKNAGPDIVNITRLESSCGCTVPALAKRTYAPGETGEIRVVFSVGEHTGVQVKTITLSTDLSAQPAIELIFRTDIPPVLRIEPPVIDWKQDDRAPAARHAILTLADEVPLEKLAPGDAGPGFVVTLQTLEPGHRYDLTVTPAAGTTSRISRAEILLILHLTGGRLLHRTLIALVR